MTDESLNRTTEAGTGNPESKGEKSDSALQKRIPAVTLTASSPELGKNTLEM